MHHLAKRRRTKVNAPKPSSFDLTITGEVCRVQQKNQLSSQETGHLIQLSYNNVSSSSWNTYGDENDEDDGGSHGTRKQSAHLLVDRRDARTLMDELSLQQLCHKRLGPSFNTDGVINRASGCHHGGELELEEEGSREEIDQRNVERFGMLPAEWKACNTIGKPDVEENDKAEHHDTCEDNKEIDDDPFEPTEEQRRGIPNDMILPRTMRQHNIIELTAARVANNHQLEIFLKLKQSNNNHLSFIHRADDLHPYYLHLKGKCSGEKQASDKANSSVSEGKSGLNVLLAGYESSCSDDEDTGKVTELKIGSAASISREQTNDDESDEQIRKDERLERLRQWKISKNLQSADDNE
mmetsp:Transcript_1372/g.2200  ORF Transcript_1372/g.2200 Transcript_1372/m.2200 type:complete len:353 (+) Transcript_1372:154-1212(+)